MKNKDLLKFIFLKVKKCWFMMGVLTFLSIFGALLSVGFSLASKEVIDTATSGNMTAFTWAVIAMLIVIVCMIGSGALRGHFGPKCSAFMDIEWKKAMLSCILHGNYSAISAYHSGNLLHRMTVDVGTVDSGMMSVLPGLSSMVIRLISAVTVMAILDPILTVAICAIGIFIVIVTTTFRKLLKNLHKENASASAKVSEILQETAENMLIVRSLDAADELEKKAVKAMDDRWRLQRIRKNIGILANGGLSIICYGLEFATLIWCSIRLMHGEITFGTLTAMVQLVGQLESPFISFSSFIPSYLSMLGSAERLKEIFDIPAEDGSPMDGHELYEKLESIEARNLGFVYDDAKARERASKVDDTESHKLGWLIGEFKKKDKPEEAEAAKTGSENEIDPSDRVMQDFNAVVKKGDFAVIIGPSGAGKSTFLKLLLGIFSPTEGELVLKTSEGEIPVTRSTRRLFSFAPQGNLLFSGTLRENLKLTAPDATDEEIEMALKIADLDSFIGELSNGIDTLVGENAEGISEGQAQRINIARAVLSGAPVLLLDEVSSSLDSATEKKVLDNLKTLGRTIVAVTHRPAALELATNVIEVKDLK